MADREKGFLVGGMQFGVGDDIPEEQTKGPLIPLRMLIVADLVPSGDFNAGASAPAEPIAVDPTEPDALFDRLRPRLAVEVPSVLDDGRSVRIDLSLKNLKSLRPDGLCAELPLLQKLLDGRRVLDRLRDGSITADQARVELSRLWGGSPFVHQVLGLLPAGGSGGPAAGASPAAAKPAAPAADEGPSSISNILDMVDMGDGGSSGDSGDGAASPPPAAAPSPAQAAAGDAMSKLSGIISQVARSARAGKGVKPDEAIHHIDNAIGAQIGAILQHPEVRRLEQAWRGLSFLVERSKGIDGLKIEVASASPDDAANAIGRAVSHAKGGPPVSFAVVDATIDGSAAGFALLEAIADSAEGYAVPTILNAGPGLLGATELKDVDRIDNKAALFTAPQRAPWRSSVAKPCMRWVTLAMNDVLCRGPYTKSTSRVREAPIAEAPSDDDAVVWMSPCFAVGSLVTSSFKSTGWPCRITGGGKPGTGGVVENLPVREIDHGTSTIAVPTRAFISTDSQKELSRYGVLLVASAMNDDMLYILSAPTAYVPPEKRSHDTATQEPEIRLDRVPLGDQLFVARLVQFTRALCSKIPPDSDPKEVQPVVEAAVWALFEDGPPAGPQLTVTTGHGDDGGVVATVTVRPRRFLGVGLDEISLDLPLG